MTYVLQLVKIPDLYVFQFEASAAIERGLVLRAIEMGSHPVTFE